MQLYSFIHAGEVAAAAVLFPLLGAILVSARFIVKRRRGQKLVTEDWLALGALIFVLGMSIAALIGVASKAEGYPTPGEGEEYEKLDLLLTKIVWNTEWMQPLSLGCIKLSFVFLYRRIFAVPGRGGAFNIVSIVSIVLLTLWSLGFYLSVMLVCPGHIEAYWIASEREVYCYDTTPFLYAYSWTDVFTDLLVIIMPIPCIMKLQMTLKRKLAIIGIFLLGIITLLASILRAVFLIGLMHAKDSELALLDVLQINTNGLYWMLIESGLGLIAVNLPILYGSLKSEGVNSMVKRVRGFASLHSSKSIQSSQAYSSHGAPHAAACTCELEERKDSRGSSAATPEPQFHAVTPKGMEEGKIHVTNWIYVEEDSESDTRRQHPYAAASPRAKLPRYV